MNIQPIKNESDYKAALSEYALDIIDDLPHMVGSGGNLSLDESHKLRVWKKKLYVWVIRLAHLGGFWALLHGVLHALGFCPGF